MTVMRHCSVLEPLLSYYHLSSYMQSLQREGGGGGIRVSEKQNVQSENDTKYFRFIIDRYSLCIVSPSL